MPVCEIFLLRHGHRLAWSLDPTTGKYTSSHPFPTRLPADPPLASHGVRQSEETGMYLSKELLQSARSGTLRIYSSLFYRCFETLRPTVEGLQQALDADGKAQKIEVRGERGVGEWFGHAWFEQPSPAEPAFLKEKFFPWVDAEYKSLVVPDQHGERIGALHERIAKALQALIEDVDREFDALGRGAEGVTVLICGHAAQIIASGRVLTGSIPADYDEEDFFCYTCGISRFERRKQPIGEVDGDWRRNGVAGGFDCVLNSDCSHLSQGEERGWKFHGDESFDSYGATYGKGPKVCDGSYGESSKL